PTPRELPAHTAALTGMIYGTRYRIRWAACAISLAAFLGTVTHAAATAPQVGQPAPDFTAKDSKGVERHLHDYRGKTVVLEWTNADCPYTRKHSPSHNMQDAQALAQKNG